MCATLLFLHHAPSPLGPVYGPFLQTRRPSRENTRYFHTAKNKECRLTRFQLRGLQENVVKYIG